MRKKDFWHKKRVAVTGASGFIGGALCNALHSKGAEVYGIFRNADTERLRLLGLQEKIEVVHCDICDLEGLKNAFSAIKPHICYHLAAQSSVNSAKDSLYAALNTNILGTMNICEAGNSVNSALVFSSSGKAYGNPERKHIGENAGLEAGGVYGASKAAGEKIINIYKHNCQLAAAILRLGNVYGPKDMNLGRIVPNTIKLALQNESPVINGDGSIKRNFVFIDDVVNAFVNAGEKIWDSGVKGETFNIASGEYTTILSLVENIIEITGKKDLKIDFRKDAYAGEQEAKFSTEKAKHALHWKPNYNLERGLKETIEWYRGFFK